jgi:hypothetical protein
MCVQRGAAPELDLRPFEVALNMFFDAIERIIVQLPLPLMTKNGRR